MGLFDSLFGDPSATTRELTRQEAFAGILLGAGCCDGRVSEKEVQGLFTITERMKLFENVSPHKWNGMMAVLVKAIERDGVTRLVDRCAAVLPDSLRDCAFANACDIVLADGVVETEERAFLDGLRRALDLDRDTARTIVDVMIAKNKG